MNFDAFEHIYAGAIARLPTDGSQPRFATCWEDLSAYAAWLRAEREKHYPNMVEAGTLTAAEASAGLVAIQALDMMWADAAACRLPVEDYPADRTDMIWTLLKPLATLDRRLDAYPDDETTRDRRDCLLAMIWWLRRHFNGPIFMVEATHIARARIAADNRKEAA